MCNKAFFGIVGLARNVKNLAVWKIIHIFAAEKNQLTNANGYIPPKCGTKTYMMNLASTDYADLLRYLAFKRRRAIINKTQVNKMLFMCYGTYLALLGEKLFEEAPRAWPFGPVFPRVYKTFDRKDMPIIIPNEERERFNANMPALNICCAVVDKFSHTSAYSLSVWSHREGSPWYQTVYDNSPIVWNKVIPDETIKAYFTENPVVRFNK